MRSMFSADGKQWIYGDAFGLTRVDLGKALKVSKHTIKMANPIGTISMTLDGKQGMCDGHEQGGAYGNSMLLGFGLPGLGLKHKLSEEIAGIATTPAGVRVAVLKQDTLVLSDLDGPELRQERELSLTGGPDLGALRIGPQRDPATPAAHAWPLALLRLLPDGRYVALTVGRTLVAGKLGDAADADQSWWRASLETEPMCEVSLEVVGEDVWLTVMDAVKELAHIAQITRDGVITRHELPAISVPAFTGPHIAYQPSAGEVRLRTLATGEEQVFDVSAHNPHLYSEADLEVFKGSPAPPAPTRLQGHLGADGKRVFFVPWHAETIVELGSGLVMPRGLPTESGMFRRLVQEILARKNALLSALQYRIELISFEHDAKGKRTRAQCRLPGAPPQFLYAMAGHWASDLSDRYELTAGGWSWGSFGTRAGPPDVKEVVTRDAMIRLVDWMITADALPFEVTHPLCEVYGGQMGIPSASHLQDEPVLSGVPERVLLRAMLESIKACGWPVTSTPASWATQPITAAMANDAIQRLHTWSRYVPYHGIQALCFMLTHHMGTDAAPVLIKLIEDFPEPPNWQLYRNAGECLTWLCNRHPELKDSTIAALQAVDHAAAGADGWAGEKETIIAALERSAKHMWSNG